MTMSIALVGIGKIARDQHVPALQSSSDWTLAATQSRNGTVEGIESHSDFGEMLAARPDIETISLCLPPAPRFDYAMQAMRAGRHVMLEKPPGSTVAECMALEAAARENGVSIYATWHSREAAGVAPARDWLAGKRLKALRIVWKEDARRWHPGQDWIWEPAGFGIFDPTINAFSIVTEILADPFHVVSGEMAVPENCAMPSAATLTFSHPHGAEMTADLDFLKEGEQIWRIEIETEEGDLTLSDGGATLTIDGVEQAGGGDGPDSDDGTNPLLGGEYTRLYAKMAALVRDGRSDFDMTPMILTADAFLQSRRRQVAPFEW